MTLLLEGTDGAPTIPRPGLRIKGVWELFSRIPALSRYSRTDVLLAVFAGVLTCAAVGLVAGLIAVGAPFGPLWPVAALAAFAFFAERRSVRVSATTEVSVSFLAFIFAAVTFGPLAAISVGAAGLLSQFGKPYIRWTIWTASRALVAGMAGIAATAVLGPAPDSFGALVAAVAAASAVEVLSDIPLNGLVVSLRGTGSLRSLIRTQGPVLLATVPIYTPVIAVLAHAYTHFSPWSVALFLIPAFAAQHLFLLYRQQRNTAQELAATNERLQKANLSFATALVATLDARDHYTAGHSAAVAIYSRDIAARLGLSAEHQQLAHVAGLVHDIGKIGLAPGVLEKTGPLRAEERREMENHTIIGERILANVDDYAEIATIVRHHHERVDGSGYPDGLVSSEIPLISKIIAVADAYDAMTSDRPYREAMPSHAARVRLAHGVETQFDTTVVAAFEAILATSSEGYRSGERRDFKFDVQDRYSETQFAADAA